MNERQACKNFNNRITNLTIKLATFRIIEARRIIRKQMLDWICRHPLCATLSIGAGTVLASEVIWLIIKYANDKIKYNKKQLHEILIFNELGYICLPAHRDGIKKCDNIHCAQNHIDRIKELIDLAKYSIDLAMFSLNSVELINVLRRALDRRVQIRIILHSTGRDLNSNLESLAHMGARIRIVSSDRKMMHHKFCVIDGRQRIDKLWHTRRLKFEPTITNPSVVISGSANWTPGSFGGNFENVVISTNKLIVCKLEKEFERMWKVFLILT